MNDDLWDKGRGLGVKLGSVRGLELGTIPHLTSRERFLVFKFWLYRLSHQSVHCHEEVEIK